MATAAAPQGRKRGATHSGRLLLRMPESLHAELARASERAGVSLNGYINDVLAAAAAGRRPSPAQAPRRRRLELLLTLNVIVVAAVGVLAIVLLVQAIR